MLLKDFYSVVEKSSQNEGLCEAKISIDANHPIFQGHFPNYPVTPGVGLLQIAKELTESHLETELFLKSANNVKFLTVVNPFENNILKFKIHLEPIEDHFKAKILATFPDGTAVLKCNATFAKAN